MTPSTLITPHVTAHIDGSCTPNPGRGAYGVILRSGPHEKQLSGPIPEDPCTNQRAELHAALKALLALKMPCKIHICSDSKYLIETMRGNYRRNANRDLWEQIDEAAAPHAVAWTWIRRGSNTEAHELAESAIRDADGDPGDHDCIEDVGAFLRAAYDARAVRQEWEEG